MKPNWNEAPEWANYFAIDKDGYSFWYEEKPEVCDHYDEWLTYGRYVCFDSPLVDWTTSLEKRPEEK